MKTYRRMFALLMTLVMLLGMFPAAQAEVIQCDHNWAWRWPNGQPAALFVSLLTCWVVAMLMSVVAYRLKWWRKKLPNDLGDMI